MDRFSAEGVDGLRDRLKSGRHSDISSEVIYEIKNELISRKQGWTTKQIEDLIVKKSGGIRYHYTHIYIDMHKWGFKQKVPRRVHVNIASNEEKERFKKEQERYWII